MNERRTGRRTKGDIGVDVGDDGADIVYTLRCERRYLKNSNRNAAILHALTAALFAYLLIDSGNEVRLPVYLTSAGTIRYLDSFRFAWLVVFFEVICAVAHAVSFRKIDDYMQNLRQFRQPLRWLEYSVSASLMIVAISALSLVSDTVVLAGVVICCATTMGIGYFVEAYNVMLYDSELFIGEKPGTELKQKEKTKKKRIERDQMMLFLFGFLPYVFLWVPLLATLFDFIETKPANSPDPPTIIWVMIAFLVVVFTCFAKVQYDQIRDMRMPGLDKRGVLEVYIKGEKTFIKLSALAKNGLAAIVFAGFYAPAAASDEGEGWTKFYRLAVEAERCTKELVFGSPTFS